MARGEKKGSKKKKPATESFAEMVEERRQPISLEEFLERVEVVTDPAFLNDALSEELQGMNEVLDILAVYAEGYLELLSPPPNSNSPTDIKQQLKETTGELNDEIGKTSVARATNAVRVAVEKYVAEKRERK